MYLHSMGEKPDRLSFVIYGEKLLQRTIDRLPLLAGLESPEAEAVAAAMVNRPDMRELTRCWEEFDDGVKILQPHRFEKSTGLRSKGCWCSIQMALKAERNPIGTRHRG